MGIRPPEGTVIKVRSDVVVSKKSEVEAAGGGCGPDSEAVDWA